MERWRYRWGNLSAACEVQFLVWAAEPVHDERKVKQYTLMYSDNFRNRDAFSNTSYAQVDRFNLPAYLITPGR